MICPNCKTPKGGNIGLVIYDYWTYYCPYCKHKEFREEESPMRCLCCNEVEVYDPDILCIKCIQKAEMEVAAHRARQMRMYLYKRILEQVKNEQAEICKQ